MYYYLNGILALLEPDRAVIDCGGVGYLVSITRKTYDSLAAGGAFNAAGNTLGKNAKLFTYYVVREDAAELYGFFSERERDLFKLLIGISGVGPKAALAVLSVALAGRFCRGGRLPGRACYFRCPRCRTQIRTENHFGA